MGKLKSSSEDPNETISKVLSGIWKVVWFIVKWSFIIAFWVFCGVFVLILAGLGVKLPDFDFDSRPGSRAKRKFDPEKFRRELKEMRVEDLLQNFGDQLEKADRNNQLNPEEKKVFRKLRGLDRLGLRSQLKESISDDDMEIIFLFLIKLLSGELR